MQWLMLQQDRPEDFVISTGRQESIRTFVELTAEKLGWNKGPNQNAIKWEGDGIDEVGIRQDTKQIVVKIDPRYFRPTEVDNLLGDSTYAKEKLSWTPKISLENLIEEMIENDIVEAKKEVILNKNLK